MSQAATYPWLTSPNARTGNYNGMETAVSFGNPAAELEALSTGCGVFSLAWRSRIKVTGKDRVRWLHNMVTNNVRDLPLNRGKYNFVLNAQGRILGDMYIFNRGESLVLETDASQVDTLLNTMKRFIIMDKVEMVSAGESVTALGVCGPKSEAVLKQAGVDAASMEPLEIKEISFDGVAIVLVRGPEQRPGWFEIWIDSDKAQACWQRLTQAGTQPVGSEALEMWRVLRGIPNYGQDIRDRDLPQETEQLQALTFTKGCYIGQEIVERIRARGQVHRKFTGFIFDGQIPAIGKYESEGRAVAEVTTTATVPAAGANKNIGLGYVRREALSAGPKVNLNGIEAAVTDLPFEI